LLAVVLFGKPAQGEETRVIRRLLYVATPGVRDYLEYGGHGVLVFDIDQDHRFVRRIATRGVDETGKPLNVKGICASAATSRLHVSTTRQLMCLSLENDELLWETTYEAGCDRMAITPDGKTIFLPSLEGPIWYVVNAADGSVIRKIVTDSGAHNTLCGLSGTKAYLAGLKSPLLRVADADSESVTLVGPFSASIRPFTVDGRQRRCYVNVNELLGFEIGDLATGKKLASVKVEGFEKGPVKRHGCPSHGIALTPDEKEIWLTDSHNQRLHIFDATQMPPVQVQSIELRDEPGWVTFTVDGEYAYPSTGQVIETKSRRIVVQLTDESARQVQSEKMVEIDFDGPRVLDVGNQFGIGRIREAAK
jgi:hypothetical protein